MMKAPLRPGTRPVGAATLAVEVGRRHVDRRACTGYPLFATTPGGDGPRPQDRRGGVLTYLLGLLFVLASRPCNTPAHVETTAFSTRRGLSRSWPLGTDDSGAWRVFRRRSEI